MDMLIIKDFKEVVSYINPKYIISIRPYKSDINKDKGSQITVQGAMTSNYYSPMEPSDIYRELKDFR